MNRVLRRESGIIPSPKQKRLSVGFGTTASVQIHASGTPKNNLRRLSTETAESACTRFINRSGTTSNIDNKYEPDMATPPARIPMSLHDNLLLRILSTPSDQPLFRRNSSDGPVSQHTTDDSFDSCLSGSSTPVQELLTDTPDAMRGTPPPDAEGAAPNRHLQLLYRDLNSPSATARLRALRALKSPSRRNAYANFDVSYAEQDIITAEERIEQEKRSIQDILRDVRVYVEVRSGTDNRSDGIKEHIASLGAKVNERLRKDTTHVIFKDGLLSTYQKAKKMNVPVVSVLWVEACKRHMCLMNPEDFKISNSERYENPELFKRIRRQKSMQPGAEETVGQKKRAAAGAKTKAPFVSPPSKLPVLHRIRKDDGLERILSDFEADNEIFIGDNGPVDEYDEILQAAPKRMLERFRSTPTGQDSPTAAPHNQRADDIKSTPGNLTCDVSDSNTEASRVSLFYSGSKNLRGAAGSRSCRKTILFTPQMTNVEEELFATDLPIAVDETPKQSSLRNRRRTVVGDYRNDQSSSEETPRPARNTSVRSRRKTMVTVVNKDSHSHGSCTPTTIRTRRSSTIMPCAKDVNSAPNQMGPSRKENESLISVVDSDANLSSTNRYAKIVACKENISPSTHLTSVDNITKAIPDTNKYSCRKTITVESKENTPRKASIEVTAQRATIYSPKDMDISNVQQSAIVDVPVSELVRSNSKDSEMSVSLKGTSAIENFVAGETDASVNITSNVRRRTLFTLTAMGEGRSITSEVPSSSTRLSAMSISSSSTIAGRRRTLFTPQNSTCMDPLEVSETPSECSHSLPHSKHHDTNNSIISRPNPTSSSILNPVSVLTTDGNGKIAAESAINERRKTLLEEYEETLVFSSTRAPERRRRTIFDISMDIMDQRLSEINRQAAAAKGQSASSSTETAQKLDSTHASSVIAATHKAITSPLSQSQQKSIDTFYRKAIKSVDKANKPTSSTSSITETPTQTSRKRKLFNIQMMEPELSTKTPPPVAASAPKTTSSKHTEKRRSLAATVGTAEPVSATAVPASTKKRRTTVLFESPFESQSQAPLQPEEQKKRPFPVGRGLPTMGSQQTQKMRQYLATTNLHTEQSEFVKEAINNLDGFIIETDVTDNTTHLVTLEPRRTINLLRALIRGIWIVRYEWIVESFHARHWLSEEKFEVRNFSSAVQINRSERQAFGSQYRNELFADYGPFWISPRCTVPAGQLRELMLLCRGKVTGNRFKAKYLVVGENDEDVQYRRQNAPAKGQTYVTVLWILDSISANRVKKLVSKYRLE